MIFNEIDTPGTERREEKMKGEIKSYLLEGNRISFTFKTPHLKTRDDKNKVRTNGTPKSNVREVFLYNVWFTLMVIEVLILHYSLVK